MNIYGGKQLADSFRTVRKNTIQVAEDIPESKYSFVAAEGTRPVWQTLSHIAVMTPFWSELHGANKVANMEEFDFFAMWARLEAEEEKPRSKAELIELLKTEGDKFAAFLEGVADETLAEEFIEGGGAKKTRLEALMGAKEHEMHCRSQLMLIERMLGVVPHLTKRFEDVEKQFQEYKKAQAAKQS